ncbi:Uncharacterized protein TPAR_06659 [Tolypocladium paradoxum]|uniref:Phospholipase D n=1 Tax=Tolypocladium paradoxum TaxID=94208 RepID=A0A2S4KSI5_9HYPO|nr:Uncharacterized protein TPAR_06659 [Tolypocladium paradoxum]
MMLLWLDSMRSYHTRWQWYPFTLVTGPTEFLKQDVQELNDPVVRTVTRRPLYVIAHRVLTIHGVKAALSQGANALEIDVTPWPSGWWADHDGSATSAGDTVEKMFQAIAEQRRAGENVIFVWLDIKSPNWCDPRQPKTRHCSVIALQEQARRILEPADVRVLYGFYGGAASGVGYDFICDDLDENEAINLNGEALQLEERFESSGISDLKQRVMSYGDNDLSLDFGNCYEAGYYTCTELRQASRSKMFGQVYGWTLAAGQKKYSDLLLGDAHVDGIIYGFRGTIFHDHKDTRAAFQDIKNWVDEHPKRRYLATAKDSPW